MNLPAELRRPLKATETRVRVQRALDAGVMFALPGLGLAGLTLALMKTGALAESSGWPWLAAAMVFPLVGAAVGALRRVPVWLPSKLLDRAHDLDDRLTNAVAFADQAEPTAFMRAAVEDAAACAKRGLRPAAAMPFTPPRDLLAVAGLAMGVLALGLLEVPRYVERATAVTRSIDAVALHADDLDAYESELRGLLDDPETPPPVREAAQEFNRIVEDLADARLDRAESLRRIAELERQLQATRPAGAELMRESLEQLGQDLRRAELADELSAALRDGDAARAESEMRRLAEQLRQDDANRAELERLRRALQRAAGNQPEDQTSEIERREEEMRRLLRRQQEQTETPEAQRRLLQRRQRELDRLRRENQEAMERRRQLERLQREMNRAAENLQQQERQQAGEDLDRGAEDLNRMAQEQMSEEQMRRLQQQLEQLREQIRQQQRAQNGQQGQQQQGQGQRGQGQRGQSQMDRFVMRANGQGNTRLRMPGQQGQGQQGQGQQGQGQQGQGQQGQGQQGQGQQGQGQQGQGQRGQGQQGQQGQGEGQQVLTLGGNGGENNAVLEIPGMGQGAEGQGQGQGQARLGPGAGTGHDGTQLDDPTRLGGSHNTVRVEGEQRGGPSRSQVILSSAQRGFANREYRDVYTDYSGHAEEVLERDEVPPGYRFYVRRYFQLIRPRDGQ